MIRFYDDRKGFYELLFSEILPWLTREAIKKATKNILTLPKTCKNSPDDKLVEA